ncbi:[NiFe]-hydrogenase assembly chaperone HybE [Roseibium sp. Sym1]|uniref:[NiFe]-hydrogenase assembly chaperone HybE n=1 Tax=Roseibium sp. Sym1 TaxID=3016006 RepID=UPI0022B36EEE|nr:[NiFe]-hydrogenase assembly chaperone HybE [Roseibium sp. Sym1]
MSDAAEVTETVERCFRSIRETRMEGIPILNDVLEVELSGLRPWEGFWLGTLLTPWFLNVILLSVDAGDERIPAGTKRCFRFPSGSYEFIRGEEGDVGPYWMCSLFSPVFEFSDQETARACALAALDALFEAEEAPGRSDAEMAAIWRGELPDPQPDTDNKPDEEDEVDEVAEPVAVELSRRSLLTGRRNREAPNEP